MAPPRFGQQTINAPYGSMQHAQMQSHNPSQQQGTLPPPSHLNTPGYQGANSSPFALGGSLNNGFERGIGDGNMLGGQMGPMFARGAPVPGHQGFDGLANIRENKDDSRIRNVWKNNLKEEMATLRQLVEEYPFIAMDTEFPGIVARPIGSFTTKADYHYQTLRCNVDLLKMIQLGITLFKVDGSLPPPDFAQPMKSHYHPELTPAPCTWQFNFRFSLQEDMYAQESTQMLTKAGIDFDRHSKLGIDPRDFGSYLISSGLVLDPDVHWISFHSGYDFGYLMKLMICKPLPDSETQFHMLLEKFFPSLFDIKFMLKHAGAKGSVNNSQALTSDASLILTKIMTKSGLQDIAEELNVNRIGQAHQAGSDSLLTGQVYFKMKERIFNGSIDEERYRGQVWGLNAQMPSTNNNTNTAAVGANRDLSTPNMNGATFYSHNANAVGQNGNPSTPQTGNTGMASGNGSGQNSHTPVPPQSSHGHVAGSSLFGSMTPGAFGNFQYGKAIS